MEKQINNLNGFVPIWIIVILILALVAGVGMYFKEKAGEEQALEEALPVDETADWKVYQNEKYGYELKYPKDWIVEEVKEEHPMEEGLMVEFIEFNTSDKNYFLLFNLREKGSNVPLSPRTGVGAGDFVEGDTVKIGNVDVKTTNLIYKGKIKEVFYSPKGPGIFEINGFEGLAEFSYGDIGVDYESIDMANLPELETANKILSTFKFVK